MEWIDINERKPEEGVKVLTFDQDGETQIRFWVCGTDHWENAEHRHCSFGWVTHWMPVPPPPRKVRWKPKEGESFAMISSTGATGADLFRSWGGHETVHKLWREFLGVYKTEQEAEQMAAKIRRFVADEIGEVE